MKVHPHPCSVNYQSRPVETGKELVTSQQGKDHDVCVTGEKYRGERGAFVGPSRNLVSWLEARGWVYGTRPRMGALPELP